MLMISLVYPNNPKEDGQLDFPWKELIEQRSLYLLHILRVGVQVQPERFEHIQLRGGNDVQRRYRAGRGKRERGGIRPSFSFE